jgi:peptidoglycan/xylan/chitin deacetylase (PgdA/CDA1 family)
MRVPGARRARTAGRWLRSRVAGRLLVLGYHRVAGGSDPYGLAVRPDYFAAHLDALGEHARVLPLAEATVRLQAGTLPRRAVVLTFDDGYADMATRVAPMLAARGMTATVFVATGFLGGEFWWDRLARVVAGNGGEPLAALHARFEAMEPGDRDRRVAELEGQHASPGTPEHRALDAAEVIALAAGGVVEVGGHTVRHLRLTAIDPAQRVREVRECKRFLEELTGRPVTAFSYPHGAFDPAVRDDIRDAGYRVGCSSVPDVGRRSSDPLALPRLWVGDWSGERFGRWLRRWLPRGSA